LGSSFTKTKDEIKRQVENKTQGEKKKGEETNFVYMRTSLQLKGGFGT
jgi:hypothetical protein